MDRRLKNKNVHNRLEKRVIDQDWADYEEVTRENIFGRKANGVQEV